MTPPLASLGVNPFGGGIPSNDGASVGVLTDEQLVVLADLLAPRLAALLAEPPTAWQPSSRLVDAAAVAEALGVSRRWVYEHASELGAQQLGTGSRPRQRFDLNVAREWMARCGGERSQASDRSTGADSAVRQRAGGRRSPNGAPKPGSILASRPVSA